MIVDVKIHYVNIKPEKLKLLYPYITFVFDGETMCVQVKGKFVEIDGEGILDSVAFIQLDIIEFMIWNCVRFKHSNKVYKVPVSFDEILITIEKSQINTDQLEVLEMQ